MQIQRLLALFGARRLIQDGQQTEGVTGSKSVNTSTICATLAGSIVRLLSRSGVRRIWFS
jgi:hypothetical protein